MAMPSFPLATTTPNTAAEVAAHRKAMQTSTAPVGSHITAADRARAAAIVAKLAAKVSR